MADSRADGDTMTERAARASSATAWPSAPSMADTAAIVSSDPSAISADAAPEPVPGAGAPEAGPGGKVRLGDRVFLWMTTGASAFVIGLVILIAVFLLIQSVPSILDDKVNFFTSTQFQTTRGDLRFGIASLLYTTVAISLLALIIAVPLAIGIALFITQYAPRRFARPTAYVIDLLAAIPSIVYGVWGPGCLHPPSPARRTP